MQLAVDAQDTVGLAGHARRHLQVSVGVSGVGVHMAGEDGAAVPDAQGVRQRQRRGGERQRREGAARDAAAQEVL